MYLLKKEESLDLLIKNIKESKMSKEKELNKLYSQCDKFINKTLTKEDNTIAVKFGIALAI